jgi:hypothetical protein
VVVVVVVVVVGVVVVVVVGAAVVVVVVVVVVVGRAVVVVVVVGAAVVVVVVGAAVVVVVVGAAVVVVVGAAVVVVVVGAAVVAVVVGRAVVVGPRVVVGAAVVVGLLTGDAAACAGRITDCTIGRIQELGSMDAMAPVPTALSSGRRSNLTPIGSIRPQKSVTPNAVATHHYNYTDTVASQYIVTLNPPLHHEQNRRGGFRRRCHGYPVRQEGPR